MYEEAAPPAPLAGVARCVWRSASATPKRIVPDGCLDLVVGDGAAFIAGPDTAAWSSVTRPREELRGVRFAPGRAAAVLGVAADELCDTRVPLGELWGREGELLAERLLAGEVTPAEAVASRLPDAAAPDPAVVELVARLGAGVARVAEAVALLGRPGTGLAQPDGGPAAGGPALAWPDGSAAAGAATLPRLEGSPAAGGAALARPDGSPAAGTPAALARADGRPAAGAAPVRGGIGPEAAAHLARHRTANPPELAAARLEPSSIGERRLRRRFVQAVGYGPATYLRVSRFQRAVALAPRSSSLAALAVAAGYSDQAHLSRECRALTGLTPRAYFRLGSTVDVA
ncbi:helix-turn-helix domain-containing protein [Amycolatopsis solani]|uniref:helix-turn-helix domain-containing protein n=3 Tax=Amycolatopsis solani TaxID=3028615 RepID=UPI00296FE9D4|nr:helix-turn-helix domain-containing protein [Amycolatopsis sp. MEP2-6]